MAQTIYQVDSFTQTPFAGNPAAVCILPKAADEQWMQNLAHEMNLSETAFVVPQDDGFDLRWFTPAVEVNLCGHATLASAHILWETAVLDADTEARFHTLSGLLTAKRAGDLIEMDFPATPAKQVDSAPDFVDALGVAPIWIGQYNGKFLIEVESDKTVEDATPDFGALRKSSVRGVIITSTTTREGIDFVSRFFAPAVGIDEDPVTGSAHCILAPYWAAKLGKPEMTGYQASARGGVVRVRTNGDRVVLGGHAVTVFRAELLTA
ncbi:MAG: PhzF family phenazine biosynthesis isomerase [candidate division Zixibacteria bacterium]|nr:PhzF family phenazine biosynthesis isomerase [candidate division Zixibacteria bacterium]